MFYFFKNTWHNEDWESDDREEQSFFEWISSFFNNKSDGDWEEEDDDYDVIEETSLIGAPISLLKNKYNEDNPDLSFTDILPSIPQYLKLYTMYNLGGLNLMSTSAAALAGDKILMKKMGLSKHYLTLSAFYGSIAYNVIMKITSKDMDNLHDDESLSMQQYLFSSLVLGAAVSMIVWGKDIFNLPLNIKDNALSAKAIGTLLDKDGGIAMLEEEFDKGTLNGLKFAALNPHTLNNPLFKSLAVIETMELAKIFLLEKYFPYSPTGTLALFLATEKTGITAQAIGGPILSAFIRKMSDLGYDAISEKFKNNIKQKITLEASKIIFETGDPQAVLRYEDICNLSTDLNRYLDNILSDLSRINRELVVPKPAGMSLREAFEKLPSLLLLKEFIEHFVGYSEVQKATKKVSGLFSKTKESQDDEFTKSEPLKGLSGFGSITVTSNPDSYASSNLQNIMKLRAGGLTYNLLERYAKKGGIKKPHELSNGEKFVDATLNLLKDGLYSLLYIAQLHWLGINSTTISDAEYKIGMISSMLTPAQRSTYKNDYPEDTIQTMQKVVDGLDEGVAKIGISSDENLHLKNYHLYSTISEGYKPLDIVIEDLEFKKGKVTALNGRNGSGKTTLLNSIAGCLPAAFDSEGTILLPSIDQENPVKIIYCGSEAFSPPGASLFETIAFRIPSEYLHSHKEKLESDIKKIAGELGESTNDIISKLNQKNVGLSTGQGCIVLTIGALLYKQYLQEEENISETIMIFDETFPNIDISTQDAIFKLIRSMASEDIVIAVQHGAERMMYNAQKDHGFFDEIIDITGYRYDHGANLSGESSDIESEGEL